MFMGDSLIVVLWMVPVVLFIITPLATLLIYSLGFFNPLFTEAETETEAEEDEPDGIEEEIQGVPAFTPYS